MSIIGRLFGGSRGGAGATDASPPPTPAEEQAAEQAYERELMRAEAERLSSDLLQRQLRYADRSWTPPAQGGEERATLGGGEPDQAYSPSPHPPRGRSSDPARLPAGYDATRRWRARAPAAKARSAVPTIATCRSPATEMNPIAGGTRSPPGPPRR